MSVKHYLILFSLFTVICVGLGYSVLNRVDVRTAPGLVDVTVYRALVRGEPATRAKHMRYRVLVPWLARPIYRVTSGRVGSWDAAMLGLVVVDALFTAATVILLMRIALQLTQNRATALIAALFYLVNFAVPNLRLVGFVDAGEGFFLLALATAFLERRLWLLPLIFIFGTLTKESFVVFALIFGAAWWFHEQKRRKFSSRDRIWMLSSVVAAFVALFLLHWAVAGVVESPLQFGAGMKARSVFLTQFHQFPFLQHLFFVAILDVSLVYVFGWLVPMALPRLKELPAPWRFATFVTVLTAFFLNSYYGGGPGTLGRALFSIAGPMLTLSATLWILQFLHQDDHRVVEKLKS